MAQQEHQLDRLSFCCPICLDLLKDPVTIPCGHSYCMNCIQSCWNGDYKESIHSCPQCRKTFTSRPVLMKNILLAEIVEELKKTGLQDAPADHCYAGPEDVACDVCTGRKLKAKKSCLFCLVSYCEKHLQLHYDVPQLKKHKLVEPSRNLQENICFTHDEVMKMFCCTNLSLQILQRVQDREGDVKLLQQQVEPIDWSAKKTVEDSEKIFTELIRLIQKRSSDVKQQVTSQQETKVSQVKECQEELEQEITELKRKAAELEQLSHTEDHIHFLHNYRSLSALSESTHSSSINIHLLRYFEDVTAAMSELRDKLQDTLRQTWTNISLTEVDVLLSEPEPQTRAGFLQYSCELTLDPNTAYRKLELSKGNRKVTPVTQPQPYSDHPDRFTGWRQVLSRESLTGRCYWEVEWRGGVSVAVAFKSISRAGGWKCGFGYNDKSWALDCHQNMYRFYHNNILAKVSVPPSSRVGVYLDHRVGILSFYRVSETMTLLHSFRTTFTEPLYAGLWLGRFSSCELCSVK